MRTFTTNIMIYLISINFFFFTFAKINFSLSKIIFTKIIYSLIASGIYNLIISPICP
uniref:Uncharacterized protein n=1 Tax=Myoviridae sp. ctCo31 TaxID=2825053 RepID=A0A8S5UMC6_9CAUD|nr:MAG TPA: hypothetical protein [Myoviridae sp. ctCo31]